MKNKIQKEKEIETEKINREYIEKEQKEKGFEKTTEEACFSYCALTLNKNCFIKENNDLNNCQKNGYGNTCENLANVLIAKMDDCAIEDCIEVCNLNDFQKNYVIKNGAMNSVNNHAKRLIFEKH